jgi:hypothetical protein
MEDLELLERAIDASLETFYSTGSVEDSDDGRKSGEHIAEEAVEDEEDEEKEPHETIVVACNRIGKENGTI